MLHSESIINKNRSISQFPSFSNQSGIKILKTDTQQQCMFSDPQEIHLQDKQEMAKNVLKKQSEMADYMEEEVYYSNHNIKAGIRTRKLPCKKIVCQQEDKKLIRWDSPWENQNQQILDYELNNTNKKMEKKQITTKQKIIKTQIISNQQRIDKKISEKIIKKALINIKNNQVSSKQKVNQKKKSTIFILDQMKQQSKSFDNKNQTKMPNKRSQTQVKSKQRPIYVTQHAYSSYLKFPNDQREQKMIWSSLCNFQKQIYDLNKDRQYRRMKMNYKSKSQEKTRIKNTYLSIHKQILNQDQSKKSVSNPQQIFLQEEIHKKLSSKSMALTQIVTKLIKDRSEKGALFIKNKKFSQIVKGPQGHKQDDLKKQQNQPQQPSYRETKSKRNNIRAKIQKARLCNYQKQPEGQVKYEQKQVNWLNSRKCLKIRGNWNKKQCKMNPIKPKFLKSYEYPADCLQISEKKSQKQIKISEKGHSKKINIFDNSHRIAAPFADAKNQIQGKKMDNIETFMEYLSNQSINLAKKTQQRFSMKKNEQFI